CTCPKRTGRTGAGGSVMQGAERTMFASAMDARVDALLREIRSRPGAENHAEWMLFRRCREGRGSQPALHFEGSTVTYGELGSAAPGCAAWLSGLGVGPGQAVLLALPDCPTLAACY